jgi:LCP family protein required for cell wall assembly
VLQLLVGLVSFAIFAVAVGGWLTSDYLTGNIRTAPLSDGLGSVGTEKANAAGKTPMNILVIGSDTRASAADCQIGGSDGGPCGQGSVNTTAGANADVEMLVHLSANRTNATVMSIPRDTMTDLPECKDVNTGHVYPEVQHGQINSTLSTGGPTCTAKAIHQLTGAPIDHFVMIDFGGVVSMSDAIGGVHVCVDNDVYDPESQLKLAKGSQHTLKGLAALEFLRTRHGFGDGSDNVGRLAAQHVFLSSLVQQLKSANTLSNPLTLLSLAKAATKALVVDDSLSTTPALIALAGQLDDVPIDRITFVTMPNVPDPQNPQARVIPAPGAQAVFQAIANDQSLSGAPAPAQPTAAATATPTVTVDPSTAHVTVENGSGYNGRASAITTSLQTKGYTLVRDGGNGPRTATTRLTFEPAEQAAAQTVAAALGLPDSDLSATGTSSSLVLDVGADWPSGTTLQATAAAPATGPVTPPTSANAVNAAAEPGCVHVSTQDTLDAPFQGMTPIQAYARHPEIPDSDSPAARQM